VGRSPARRIFASSCPRTRCPRLAGLQGGGVFLEPKAASLLDEKVLDASVEQDQVAFMISDQVEQ
jgi:hypothetical protein